MRLSLISGVNLRKEPAFHDHVLIGRSSEMIDYVTVVPLWYEVMDFVCFNANSSVFKHLKALKKTNSPTVLSCEFRCYHRYAGKWMSTVLRP